MRRGPRAVLVPLLVAAGVLETLASLDRRLAWGFAYNFPFSMIVGGVTILAFLASKEKKDMPWTREIILLLILIGWMLFTTFFAFYPDLAWAQ